MLTTVRIVGAGLIGTSIGLGLVQSGIKVEMVDSDSDSQALAMDLVGGAQVTQPDLVIFALPSSRLPLVIKDEFALNPQ
jgi:prephenate dehydrogenase